MSQRWHNLTMKAMQITEVKVLVPSKFQKCLNQKTKIPYEKSHSADESSDIVLVSSEHFISKQYGPCGTKGRGIQLPLSSLFENETDTLLQTWVNSNYGVFLESPLQRDFWHSSIGNNASQQQQSQHNQSSRQDLLCYGKSVKEVVQLQHPGEDLSQPRDFQPPSFTYQIQPQKRAYVLMVQKSFPDENRRGLIPWEAVQSALLPFIRSLSSGDQLAIITYDQFEVSHY